MKMRRHKTMVIGDSLGVEIVVGLGCDFDLETPFELNLTRIRGTSTDKDCESRVRIYTEGGIEET